jgi:thiol-disulfide isomerase/thioredoxin
MRITVISTLLAVLLCAVLPAPVESSGEGGPAAAAQESFGKLAILSSTGEQIPLGSYIGNRAVVVVFWAAWCPLCRKEVPRLNRLADDPAVRVIAVNYRESREKVLRFMAAHDVNYTVAMDPDGSVAQAFRAPGVPYCVILGRSGTVVFRGSMLPENIEYYTGR